MYDSNNYMDSLLQAGQQISNAGGLAYADFQKQLIAARADIARQTVNAQMDQMQYNTTQSIVQSQQAWAKATIEKRDLVQDYNSYVGYYKATKGFMDDISKGEINAYVSNAKNINNAAMYNLSRNIVGTNAQVASAQAYFSGSAIDSSSGSARDIALGIADQGANTTNQKYADMLNKANAYITEANNATNNKALSDMTTEQQMSLMELKAKRTLAGDNTYSSQLNPYTV